MIETRIIRPGEPSDIRAQLVAHIAARPSSTLVGPATRAVPSEMRAEKAAAAVPKPEVSPAVARAQRVRWGVAL